MSSLQATAQHRRFPDRCFSLAAFLGARLDGAHAGLIGAGVSLMAIFLPGFLLVAGTLPFWQALAHGRGAGSALAGVNAAVVGLLAAALYQPVWSSAMLAPADFAIALIGFVLLAATRTPVLLVLTWCVIASVLRALLA